MNRKIIGLLLVLLVAVLAIGNLVNKTVVAQSEWQEKVDTWVLETAVSESTTEFLVYLQAQADLSGAEALQTKEEKGTYVFEQLTAVANQTQAAVIAQLDALGVEYKPFWVANMIWVRGDMSIVQAMAQRDDVAHLYANPTVHLDLLPPEDQPTEKQLIEAAMTVEWNIALVQAPQVWAEGYTGQGAVIGGQDTGYDWDHPALINKYRGWNGAVADHNYNWHDSITSGGGGSCGLSSPEPCDDTNHGTHTMGTMVGDDGGTNQVGMAPGAKWIGCRNMDQGNGTPATYTECYQWFIAPTDLSNMNPDPLMAPHVINNSWSCPGSEGCSANTLLSVVQAVRAAGIVTVHSAGNSGSGCNTVNTPSAIYAESFSVGSTTMADVISGFSSRGVVTVDGSNRRKPDISAPGSSVRSTVPGGGYASFSGTSMAGPHVAGLVGLVLSIDPSLAGDVDAIEDLIEQTAVPKYPLAPFCGTDNSNSLPNNVYGWGRIDALAAFQGLSSLTIAKTGTAMVAPGQTIMYTLSVTNTDTVSATNNLVLTDTIPAGTSFYTATMPHITDGTTVTWTASSLAANSSWTVDLAVMVDLDRTDDVVNEDYGVRSDESNGTVTSLPFTTDVVPYDLQVSKTAPDAVSAEALITYTLTVDNNHPFADNHGVWLSDTIPAETTFITATLPHTFDGTAVWWDVGTLAAGNSWQAELVVQTTITDTGTITNDTYSATADELLAPVAGDPVTTDVMAYALTVGKVANVSVTVPGGIISYTLTVHNPHAETTVTNLVLTDTLPLSTTLVVTGTTPYTMTGQTLQWEAPSLAAGESWEVTMVVQVDAAMGEGSIINSEYGVVSTEIVGETSGPVETAVIIGTKIYLPFISRAD
jgi:uncharacterized repeat protein (TIGR01451 family)